MNSDGLGSSSGRDTSLWNKLESIYVIEACKLMINVGFTISFQNFVHIFFMTIFGQNVHGLDAFYHYK